MISKTRNTPRQARSVALVEAIVEGAARVFDREGLEATTNRIAVEAGVSVGSLYRYFADKQSLLDAVAHRHLDEGEAVVLRLRDQAQAAKSVSAVVRVFAEGIAAHHARHPHVHALFERHVARTPALLDRAEGLKRLLRDGLASQLNRLRPSLEQPGHKADLVAAALGAGVHETVVGGDDPAAATQELVRLCGAYLDAH